MDRGIVALDGCHVLQVLACWLVLVSDIRGYKISGLKRAGRRAAQAPVVKENPASRVRSAGERPAAGFPSRQQPRRGRPPHAHEGRGRERARGDLLRQLTGILIERRVPEVAPGGIGEDEPLIGATQGQAKR